MPVSPLPQNGLGLVKRLLVNDRLMLSPCCDPLTLGIAGECEREKGDQQEVTIQTG